jgi:transcription elongation factor Elf1
MTYAEKLKDPRWIARRKEILEKDNYTCVRCGAQAVYYCDGDESKIDSRTIMHVHHLKYTGQPWDAADDDLAVLCDNCHNYYHALKNPDEIDFELSKIVIGMERIGRGKYEFEMKKGPLHLNFNPEEYRPMSEFLPEVE